MMMMVVVVVMKVSIVFMIMYGNNQIYAMLKLWSRITKINDYNNPVRLGRFTLMFDVAVFFYNII
jgi:hypothetical protein